MIRIAVAVYSVSHFEVPMYRLLAGDRSVEVRVFYLLSPKRNEAFDEDYKVGVTWGEQMLEGYPSEHCQDWRAMLRSIRSWKPDTVLFNGYSWPGALRLLLSLRLRRIPLVFRGTLNHHLDPRTHRFARIKRLFRKPVFRFFDTFHCGGSYAHRVLRGAGIRERRLFCVPYSVDAPHFVAESDRMLSDVTRDAVRRELGIASDDYVVLFVAQLTWVKGPDLAIRIFTELLRELPNAKLIVVGNGAMMPELTQQVKASPALSEHVRLVGFCPSKAMSRYYVTADLLLVSSRYETWARAVNEAMLCRLPCILNTFVAAADLVEPGRTGYLVDGLDCSQYVSLMLQHARRTGEERQSMGEAARARALDASYESNYQALLDSFLAAIGTVDPETGRTRVCSRRCPACPDHRSACGSL